jgi:energy-coupling factor transporter transmembrane protein EcfT
MEKIPTFLYYLPEKSVYFKINFLLKFLLFLSLSVVAIFNKNLLLNLFFVFILIFLIFFTGFPKHNKKPIFFIFFAVFIFFLFWILFSKIGGSTIYFTFPWKTFVSEKTFSFMFMATMKWVLIAFAGLFFMITTSESELIDFLYKFKFNDSFVLSIAIAFNTIGFAIKDLDSINYALKSRNYKENNLLKKIKKPYLIGNVLLLSNIKRIESLTESYHLRS